MGILVECPKCKVRGSVKRKRIGTRSNRPQWSPM